MNLMNKLMKKRKMNNKGFSLVELIIVIAIMAILVGIVGTQVVPYIEKSRKSKDVQILSGYCTDAMSAFSSESAKLDPKATYTITITPPAAGAAAGAAWTVSVAATPAAASGASDLKTAFCELNKLDTVAPTFGSQAGKNITGITITCSSTTSPMIKLEVAPSGSFDNITTN